MTASVMPLPAEMRRSVLSSPQTQQQRRRVAAATKAAAARWAADFEAEAHVGDDTSVPAEESPLSWWTASVSEVQALERLISARVNKASQPALDRPTGYDDPTAVAEPRLDDGSDALVALRNAGTPVEPACRANDIVALQEEFGRLAAQVRIQEGRFGPWSSALESDVAELRKMIGNLREQMEGRLHKTLTVPELLTDQATHSVTGQAEFRREVDDLRDRCSTLTGIVEDLARGQSRLADARLAPPPRQSPDVDFATIFGPEAQQVVAKVAEETAIAISRQIAEETRTLSVDCAKDAACRVAEETASSIVNVASAVQAEVTQLRQTQAEMLKEMAAFPAKQDAASRVGIVATEVEASFADALRRLEVSCKAAHDAVFQHREEHRAKHEDLTGKIATSESMLAVLTSRFEAFFSQEQFHSPKSNLRLADKTDSPGQPLSSVRPQELVEIRLDLDTAFREIRQMREERDSMLVVDTPRGRVELTSLPGELEELRVQLERVVRELREEKDNVSQSALVAVENSRIEQLLPASLQSFREEIECAICEIRGEVSKVETSCIESILPSSLQMFRDEIEKVVGELRDSISNTTERIQTKNLQLQQTDPALASDIDSIKLELQALRDAKDVDVLRSELQALRTRDIDAVKAELRTLQDDRAVQQNALDEGVVCIAKVVGDLRNELSDAREVSNSVERLHDVLEKSVANFDSVLAPTLSDSKTVADLNADFDQAQAEKLSSMAEKLGDSCVRNLQAAVDTFRRASVDDEHRLNLCRLVGVVDELLMRPARGAVTESQGDSAQFTMSLDKLRVQCQELARSIQVPSDLQLQVSELSTRVDEIMDGGTEVCETQKIALSHLESSRTALQGMIELLNNSNALTTANSDAEIDERRSSPPRPAQVPALAMEGVAPKLDKVLESSLQLPTNQAGVEELWVALGGRSLAEQVQDLRRGQVSPGRWEELRDQHAELSRMVAMMQDMHCHHVRALWEDLRAVCRELASISETSEATAAQAAAAQAMGVGAAASQAVTLWEELGTPRRAELVGMIGEVRCLRNEVERLRSVKEDDAVVADGISNVVEEVPLRNIMGDEAFLNLRPGHSVRRASWRRPSQETAEAREEIVTLTSQTTSESSGARGRRVSPKGLDGTEEAASDLGPDSGRRRPSWRQQQASQPDSGRRRPSWRLPPKEVSGAD